MSCRYYDDIIIEKIKRWIPEASNLKVLKPDESRRFFELTAHDNDDKEFKLPLIALSRNNDIELLSTTKSVKSYDGLKLISNEKETAQLNVIPIKLVYSLDIYTKTMDEGDELVRSFLFKLINNPLLRMEIPYHSQDLKSTDKDGIETIPHYTHTANLRVMNTVSDTSSISERIFSGQFTRWTIQLELQDGFLFNVPYRRNWKFVWDDEFPDSVLELSPNIGETGEQEPLGFEFIKS